jgi:hypothetical protein
VCAAQTPLQKLKISRKKKFENQPQAQKLSAAPEREQAKLPKKV